jgi:hypothetical protein
MSRTLILIFILSTILTAQDSFFAQNSDYAGQTQLLPFDSKTFNDLDRLPDLTWNNNNNCIIGKSIGTVSYLLFLNALSNLSSNIHLISSIADERITKLTQNADANKNQKGISTVSTFVVNVHFGSDQNLNIKDVSDFYITSINENVSMSVYNRLCKISTKLPDWSVSHFVNETDENFIRAVTLSYQNTEHTIINENNGVGVYDPYQLLQLNNWLIKSLMESEIAINLNKKALELAKKNATGQEIIITDYTLELFYDKKKVQDLITDELQKKYSNLDVEIIDNIVNEEIEYFIKNQ